MISEPFRNSYCKDNDDCGISLADNKAGLSSSLQSPSRRLNGLDIATRVLPDALRRLTAIQNHDSRIHKVRWREGFKKQWKEDASKLVNPEKLVKYHTDPMRWVCGCRAFLMSRFMLCKHIVYCFEPPSPEVLRTIRRQTTPPFWKDDRLVLRPEFATLAGPDIQDQNQTQGGRRTCMKQVQNRNPSTGRARKTRMTSRRWKPGFRSSKK